jgi:ribonuclease HIII
MQRMTAQLGSLLAHSRWLLAMSSSKYNQIICDAGNTNKLHAPLRRTSNQQQTENQKEVRVTNSQFFR